MNRQTFREQVYGELSRVTHAMSHPKRMELVELLAQRGFSVEELSIEISMSVASTSQHLQVLKLARLVEAERRGNFIIYRIADENVIRLLAAVRELGIRKYAEVDRILKDFKADKNLLESITLEELIEKGKKRSVILLDVRPKEEYEAGHIEGAVSIPLAVLKKRMKELPAGKTIVAYCRGPLCVMAADAVKLLNAKRYKAIRMEDGYIEWKLRQSEKENLN